MKKKVDILIIGAGASGLMLAALLKTKNIMIVDNNSKIGTKILVSGGGKCNITNGNVSSKNYLGNQRFIKNIIKGFNQTNLLLWLKERGVVPVMRKNNQYFCKNSSKEIIDIFKKKIDFSLIEFNINVKEVKKKSDIFEVVTSKGVIEAKKVIVASGGLSFPILGATNIGYKIAESFNHEIKTLSAGLVGLTVQPEQFFFKSLSGIAIDVKITVQDKVLHGALLFAHKGISGPVVLDTSLYWKKGKIIIDFLPTLSLLSLKSSKKYLSRTLGLPSRVSKAFLKELNIEDKASNSLTADEWKKLETLKAYTFAPAGTFGYSKAEVTKGGVSTDEIDARSMMSKKVDNLYFLGEVLDVTGELGGYNFQWAFSTAFVCAKGIE